MLKTFAAVAILCGLALSQAQAAPDPISADPPRATYADVKAFLRATAEAHPATARLIQLGRSDSGEWIEALALGNGPVKHLVVATHHGNEYGSTEVARAFAASLAAEPIAGLTVFVLPVLNVSGYDRKLREEKGRDPNRDYPGPCGTDGPFRLQSTAALARFVEQEGIVSSATLHTFYPAVVYPWGLTTHQTEVPQMELYRSLAEMAARESRYPIGNSTEVIYPANGTFEDYAYWKHGMWSLLFELGFSHYPSRDQIVRMAEANIAGLRRFLSEAPRTRADRHAFTGDCDYRLLGLDRRDE